MLGEPGYRVLQSFPFVLTLIGWLVGKWSVRESLLVAAILIALNVYGYFVCRSEGFD